MKNNSNAEKEKTNPNFLLSEIIEAWPNILPHEHILDFLQKIAIYYEVPNNSVSLSMEAFPNPISKYENSNLLYFDQIRQIWVAHKDWEAIGTKYILNFETLGRLIYITLDKNGKIIKRGYSDRGDVHFQEVIRFIKKFPKAISQAYKGGAPKGVRRKTLHFYSQVYDALNAHPRLNDTEFVRWWNKMYSHKYEKLSTRTLSRIKKAMSEILHENTSQ
jgi:hypothetical protein